MLDTSTHTGTETAGADEALLVFFPFVTAPDWYGRYWYREARRPFQAIALLSGIAKTLLAVTRSQRQRPARPVSPDAPALQSRDYQIASGQVREA
jgi:hypothetical protein